jgi:hypothetical protein
VWSRVVADLEVSPLACGDRDWQQVTVDLESWRHEGRGNMKQMEAGGTRWPSWKHVGGLMDSSNTIALRPPPTPMVMHQPEDGDGFLNKR